MNTATNTVVGTDVVGSPPCNDSVQPEWQHRIRSQPRLPVDLGHRHGDHDGHQDLLPRERRGVILWKRLRHHSERQAGDFSRSRTAPSSPCASPLARLWPRSGLGTAHGRPSSARTARTSTPPICRPSTDLAGWRSSERRPTKSSIGSPPTVPGPAQLAITPDGKYVYTADFSDNMVDVITVASNAVTGEVDLHQNSYPVAIAADDHFDAHQRRTAPAERIPGPRHPGLSSVEEIPVGIAPGRPRLGAGKLIDRPAFAGTCCAGRHTRPGSRHPPLPQRAERRILAHRERG